MLSQLLTRPAMSGPLKPRRVWPGRFATGFFRCPGRPLWRLLRQALPTLAGLCIASGVTAAVDGAHSRAGVMPLPGPTVKEVIEFTRIVQPVNHNEEELQTQISPDRQQAFLVIRKPDVASDVNRFTLQWMDLSSERLARGAFVPPVTLLTLDARQDESDSNPPLREVRWVDDRTLVFRARMHDEPFQVYRFDVPTRKLTQLTFAPLGLLAYDVTSDLKRIVYVGPILNPAVPPGARSIVVGTNSFWNVHFGQEGVRNQQRRFQYFVTEARSRGPARPLGSSFAESSMGYPTPSISPDGRWAALPKYEPGREAEWTQVYAQVAAAMREFGASRSLDPLSYFSRPSHYVPRRSVLYRLADGGEQTIVDAPDDSMQHTQHRSDRLWLDGGRSLILAGSYLPHSVGGAPGDSASHILEFWPDTGRWKDVTALTARLISATAVAGHPNAFVAMDGGHERRFEKGANGEWNEERDGATASSSQPAQSAAQAPSSAAASRPGSDPAPEWRLQVREALNEPPDVFATGPHGAAVRLTELNPQFQASQWGTMRTYDWKDAKGRTWRGGLMVPKDFDPSVRHALVIQTYGFAPARFYRDGSNTYDGFTSGFPGRAFLRENILVLAIPDFMDDAGPVRNRDKVFMIQDGVRAAINELVAKGIVDRDRVGIIGWSATGAQVLNLITFSGIPFRAASMVDGDANTLFSMTITYSLLDGTQLLKEETNGGGPYGPTRQLWVDRDPSLHTECIRAALRLETYGPEVHNNWDVYALLRRQYKPVEFIYIPGGSHQLSRPSERMISLQGNVDWFRFWLTGGRRSELMLPEETEKSLSEQYARWDQMATLKMAADKQPRCSGVAGGP